MGALTENPCLLTIAGFDPSSGAGISADMAVFAAHGFFGISAITAITVQSTMSVRRVQPVDAELLAETLSCLEEDLPPAGIKIGMLADRPQVQAVARYLLGLAEQSRIPYVVLDPVLRSSSGAELLTVDGLDTLLDELLPQVDVVTPNTEELAFLTGQPCASGEQIEAAAVALASRCNGVSVLVTGGQRSEPDDVLYSAGSCTTLKGTRVHTSATHGTGCAFSSAMLCGMVKRMSMEASAASAKKYVETAMRSAEPHGSGKGPMQLLWPLLQQHGQ